MLAFDTAGAACNKYTTNATCLADKAHYCYYDPSTNPVCDTDLADSTILNCTTGVPLTAPGVAGVCQLVDTLAGTCANATTRAACDALTGFCEYSSGTCAPVVDSPLALLGIAAQQGGSSLAGPYLAQIATCAPHSSEASCLGSAAASGLGGTSSGGSGGSSNSSSATTTNGTTAAGGSSSDRSKPRNSASRVASCSAIVAAVVSAVVVRALL
jgi:type IV secretory pathway TrbL component